MISTFYYDRYIIYYPFLYGYLTILFVTIPFWVYWTSPYSSHGIDHIPFMVGWCSMGTFNDPCFIIFFLFFYILFIFLNAPGFWVSAIPITAPSEQGGNAQSSMASFLPLPTGRNAQRPLDEIWGENGFHMDLWMGKKRMGWCNIGFILG